MGGDIQVESKLGEGSTFTFTVELDLRPGKQENNEKIVPIALRGLNVLIADDLKFIKLVLRELIESAGFRVVGEASNGEEAVELYQEKRPDVVLMDITMPKVDGLTALKQILKIDPAANVIMCSALGQQTLIVQALQMGAKDFIVKPFRPERVIASIKKILDIE